MLSEHIQENGVIVAERSEYTQQTKHAEDRESKENGLVSIHQQGVQSATTDDRPCLVGELIRCNKAEWLINL